MDFPTAEAMKLELGRSKSVSFTDILGLEQTLPAEELFSLLDGPIQALADEIAQRICQVNGGPPSAVFLAGGGSKLPTLCARVAAALGIGFQTRSAGRRLFSVQRLLRYLRAV